MEKVVLSGKERDVARTLQAILASSVMAEEPLKGRNILFPTDRRFVIDEFVNGTLQYIGGDAGHIRFRHYYRCESVPCFEHILVKHFERELTAAAKKLDPNIEHDIRKLIGTYSVYGGALDDDYFHNKLYLYFDWIKDIGIHKYLWDSEFEIWTDVIKGVREKVLPSFSCPERRDIEGIGKAMRWFIKEDLAFIEGD